MIREITIIEIDYHPEVLYNTCKLLKGTGLNVNIITTGKIYNEAFDKVFEGLYNWIVIGKKQGFKKMILQHLELINRSDILLFNTLASRFRFFSNIKFRPVTLLRIHNANAYLAPGKSFKTIFTPYFLFKDTSHIVRKTIFQLDWFYRKKFIKNIDFVIFPDQKIEEFAIQNGLIEKSKICPSIPIAMWDQSNTEKEKTETINITIPGTIDIRRRDYGIVFEAFQQIRDKLKNKVRLTLLGRPKDQYGIRMILKFQDLISESLQIQTFREKIPMQDFRDILSATDFLILPVNIDTKYTIYRERYGYTKISGSINDMITAGKPALIASKYPVNDRLRMISEGFTIASDLGDKLMAWINNAKYRIYEEKVSEALSFYTREHMQKYLIDIFENLKKN